jgi:hypothetical protein
VQSTWCVLRCKVVVLTVYRSLDTRQSCQSLDGSQNSEILRPPDQAQMKIRTIIVPLSYSYMLWFRTNFVPISYLQYTYSTLYIHTKPYHIRSIFVLMISYLFRTHYFRTFFVPFSYLYNTCLLHLNVLVSYHFRTHKFVPFSYHFRTCTRYTSLHTNVLVSYHFRTYNFVPFSYCFRTCKYT